MKTSLLTAMFVTVGLSATPALATDFNAFSSFTGVNGNGDFFYGSTDGTTLDLFTTGGGCVLGGSSICLHSDSANLPQASVGGSYPTVTVPTDAVLLHPGNSNTLSVYSAFVAPVAETYNYTIDLQSVGIDTTDGTGYTPFTELNGVITQGTRGTLPTYLSTGALSGTTTLSQGEAFGVIIDDNTIYYGDSTSLKFNVSAVPEPATWAMMLVGFGMIGFSVRRRNKQTVRVKFA